MIKVKGQPNLERTLENAIINTDISEYEKYKNLKRARLKQRSEIENIKSDIKNINEKLDNIAEVLKSISDKNGGSKD